MRRKILNHSKLNLERLWRTTNNLKIPVDLESIAKHLNIDIQCYDDLEYVGIYDGSIEYKSSEPEERQRFVIAHCIGHHLLHQGVFYETVDNFRASVDDYKEREANDVASEILCPELALRYFIHKNVDIRLMAKGLNVSEKLVQYRLRKLCWIT